MKLKKLLGISLILLCGLFLTYRLMNTSPDKDLSPDMQAKAIIESGSCLACHSMEPQLPFYSTFPIIGTQVKTDAKVAAQETDLLPAYNALCEGKPVDIVSLNKIEKSILDGTMPLLKYYIVHWGSSINNTEKEMILNWAQTARSQMDFHDLLAEDMKNEPIFPIPDSIAVDARKVLLGELLFFNPRLSADSTVSCATCHDLDKGATDNLQFSEGIGGAVGGVNAPTAFNSTFNFVQFWDGRAATLALQAAGPPINPIEMGYANWRGIETDLKKDANLVAAFALVYPDGITELNVTDAIEHFERTLLTPNSPFDLYLKGDETAMSDDAKKGYALFKQYDCATCHAGVNMGGQSYDYIGLREDYFAARGTEILEEDKGRYKQDKNEYFKHRFKTPGLRNIALTAPYFHDGSQETLEEAIVAMLRFQRGIVLEDEDVEDMVEFLEALTGEFKGESLALN